MRHTTKRRTVSNRSRMTAKPKTFKKPSSRRVNKRGTYITNMKRATAREKRTTARKNRLSQMIHNKASASNVGLANMLKVTCKNSGNCIALGPYNEYIKHYFKDFKDLTMIDTANVKRIGKVSLNGIVVEIPFQHLEYKAYTILKCAAKEDSDNLYYEYFVGKHFINNFLSKLPCFLETYSLYKFNDDQAYDDFKADVTSKQNISALNEKISLSSNNDGAFMLSKTLRDSCKYSKMYAILIQHFDRFVVLMDELKNNFENIKRDLYNLLYQVYFGLCYLNKTFTHYDLHTENVGLYKPFDGNQCILMRYHSQTSPNVLEFKTEYIAKIIDYGRSYFKKGSMNLDTLKIINTVCQISECDPDCGDEKGYGILNGESNLSVDYYIDPRFPNMSADLRLLYIVKKFTGIDFPNIKYLTHYGTFEDLTGNKSNVKSIFDAKERLELIMNQFNPAKNDIKYGSWKVAATMDVYDDGRPYVFTVLPDEVPTEVFESESD